jgi:thiol-disulfide isomerase/thioredoxin
MLRKNSQKKDKSMIVKQPALLLLMLLATMAMAETNKQAPAFTLEGLNGAVALEDYKGKVVYLDFWASWCSPCKDSFPWMNAMQEKYAEQGLVFVAVNVDRKKQDAETFLVSTPANFTIAFDDKGFTPKQYQVMGMPSAYVIDRHGKILHSHIGFNRDDAAEYVAHILQALNKRDTP